RVAADVPPGALSLLPPLPPRFRRPGGPRPGTGPPAARAGPGARAADRRAPAGVVRPRPVPHPGAALGRGRARHPGALVGGDAGRGGAGGLAPQLAVPAAARPGAALAVRLGAAPAPAGRPAAGRDDRRAVLRLLPVPSPEGAKYGSQGQRPWTQEPADVVE